MRSSYQRGVALVVTLLMLSVITFLAVAFLALSGRERQSVTLTITQAEAKLMADAGLSRAQAEIAALVRQKTNLLATGMLVSRSYQNPLANMGQSSYTNVNYDKVGNVNQFLQMQTNLYYDPRLPVYVRNNPNDPYDFRFYVDFNRNGRYDTNGAQTNLNFNGQIILDEDNNPEVVDVPGDPEFIGVLENPALNHSGTNRGVGRFAYMVLPVGQSLDLNTLHNYAKGNTGLDDGMGPGNDGFNRNQGVGAYEINYAGLLMDLSSNTYSTVAYNFRPSLATVANRSSANSGVAFDDAVSLLRYRYDGNYNDLAPAQDILGSQNPERLRVRNAINSDGIDSYARGVAANQNDRPWQDDATQPWAGSRSTNELRDIQELFNFDPNRYPNFVNRLKQMGNSRATMDRHGIYRLLSQATVSAPPALEGRFHLNYKNDTNGNTFISTYTPWDAVDFFTNVADRLLKMALTTNNNGDPMFENIVVPTNFGIANIPLYPATNGVYSSSLHRLLQVAANLYDATTNKAAPSVFRPHFIVDNDGRIRISGYSLVENADILTPGNPRRLPEVSPEQLVASGIARNVVLTNRVLLGVPMVVGAKKGLPNLNEVQFLSRFRLQRKLEFWKQNVNQTSASVTNQQLLADLSNELAVELWNSYTNGYTRPLRIEVTNICSTTIFARRNPNDTPVIALAYTNLAGRRLELTVDNPDETQRYWPGREFRIPIQTNMVALSNSIFHFNQRQFLPLSSTNSRTASYRDTTLLTPIFTVAVTNRLRVTVIDGGENRTLAAANEVGSDDRVIDYVSLETVYYTNMTDAISGRNASSALPNTPSMWDGLSGIQRQIDINLARQNPDFAVEPDWSEVNTTQQERDMSANGLAVFLGLPENANFPRNGLPPQILYQKAAYDALGAYVGVWAMQANDPLVHYTRDDLIPRNPTTREDLSFSRLPGSTLRRLNLTTLNQQIPQATLGRINRRYMPWSEEDIGPFAHVASLKDPMVRQSDDWEFPTNKLASLGEIGRIHRGTPWQTVYLKAGVAPNNQWREWAGSFYSHPTNDWRLPDLFTTAPSENAARGLLSVNQSDYAGWSAVLSGVQVLTNTADNPTLFGTNSTEALYIQPSSEALHRIVDGINARRAAKQAQGGLFTYTGEFLETPELTSASPFLNFQAGQNGVTEEMYERIPRRILSLVHLGSPRYLVYTYGQSLRPANASLVNRFGYLNLVTNYQVAGEVVTRTLLRVDGTPQAPRIVIEKYDVLPTD